MFSVRSALRRLSPLDRCCEDALAGALSLVAADRGNIQLGDKRTGVLRIAAQEGFDAEFLEYFAVVNDDGTACGRAAKQRSQTVIADVNTDPAFGPHREIAAASGFRAVCSTPLLDNGGRLVGIISTHYSRPYRPSQQELDTLERYARLVGPVLAQTGERIRLSGDGYVSDMGCLRKQLPPGVIAELGHRAAHAAEQMADQADRLASTLEQSAQRGDANRRLWIAHQERLISAIERRNAARLRQAGTGQVILEPLPRLGFESDSLPKTHAE